MVRELKTDFSDVSHEMLTFSKAPAFTRRRDRQLVLFCLLHFEVLVNFKVLGMGILILDIDNWIYSQLGANVYYLT
jgi:hypothetical protein